MFPPFFYLKNLINHPSIHLFHPFHPWTRPPAELPSTHGQKLGATHAVIKNFITKRNYKLNSSDVRINH